MTYLDFFVFLPHSQCNGRQAFLESQPQNFTRIVHDYSDERKGFIIWNDLLEEIQV